jgi:hypothetical protein
MYHVKSSNEKFDIIERSKEDVVIVMKATEHYARKLCKKLNSGSGFNGNTPTFFADITRKATN